MKEPLLIRDIEDLSKNKEQVERYLNSESSNDHAAEMKGYIQRGHKFVCYKIDNEYHFAPSRFIGYKNNTLYKHKNYRSNHMITGTDTDRILTRLLGNAKEDDSIENCYIEFCRSLYISPSKKRQRKYWIFTNSLLENTTSYKEGELSLKIHKQRERNRKAREQCIAFKGIKCCICGIEFEKVYGNLGKGFIQVHHITPISEDNKKHIIDPIKDLVPVCPNCHAMLHHGKCGKVLTVEKLKQIIENNKSKI